MKKGLTEMVFILDRSGSMSGLESDTIGGFNAMIEKQKNEEGEAFVSTILFNDKSRVLHDRIDIKEVPTMSFNEYQVCGCTALIDALGDAIHHIGNVHKYAREEDRPEHTVFAITTDGMENASKKYTSDQVKKMIEERKSEYGWEFIFIGANIDAVETAKTYGIDEDHSVNYMHDARGTALNYEAQSIAMSRVRCGKAMKGWKDDVDKDYRKRS